jgi:hypothetical protein
MSALSGSSPWRARAAKAASAGAPGATAHPLVARAGPEIFGDRDRRYDQLVGVIVEAAGRMRSPVVPRAEQA